MRSQQKTTRKHPVSQWGTIHTRELQRLVIEKYFSNLTEEQLSEKTKTGEILINNRIAWGKSYLKKGWLYNLS